MVSKYLKDAFPLVHYDVAKRWWQVPQSRHDCVFCSWGSGMGSFSGSLTSPKRRARHTPVAGGYWGSGWMVGAVPKFQTYDCAEPVRHRPARGSRIVRDARRLALDALCLAFVPLSLLLVQCGTAPSPGTLAANAPAASSGDTFDDRFPKPQFSDRFPTASESLVAAPDRPTRTAAAHGADPNRTGWRRWRRRSALPAPAQQDELTTLVSMKSSAFPYFGNNPALRGRRSSTSPRQPPRPPRHNGRVYWQDETYNDNRVLVHIPENFDVHKPGVIVVFFHGNGATLERDVRDRQLVPQQISDSGVNAVLLAPQFAVDAADSSAGKFWQPGGFKRFMDELAGHLAQPLRRSRLPPKPSPTCRSSSSATAADSCRPPGASRSAASASRPRRVPARRGVWRIRQIRFLDREQPHRLLRQLLHPLHQPA